MRPLGTVLYIGGGIATLAIDILSSFWLATTHGLGWVLVSWIFVLPLIILPFLAGYGIAFILAMGATFAGSLMVDAE